MVDGKHAHPCSVALKAVASLQRASIYFENHTATVLMLLQTSSAALAEELAKTVSELERLKKQQSTLEDKNALLEKCLQLNLGQRKHQAMLQVRAEQRVSSHM